jgi:hypothetical protein
MEIMAGTTLTVTDAGMVMIPVWEYEELVRDSERLRVVENYTRRAEYVSKKDLLIMLSVEEKAGEE